MNRARAAVAKLAGLFVDDRWFALAVGGWIAAVAAASRLGLGPPAARSLGLFAGLVTILLAGIWRDARR